MRRDAELGARCTTTTTFCQQGRPRRRPPVAFYDAERADDGIFLQQTRCSVPYSDGIQTNVDESPPEFSGSCGSIVKQANPVPLHPSSEQRAEGEQSGTTPNGRRLSLKGHRVLTFVAYHLLILESLL